MEHRGGPKKGRRESAAELAPAEEQQKAALAAAAVQQAGAIVVDSDNHNLSDDIAERRHGKQILGMEPVAIVILAFMFCFIAFIAWQISLMPEE